MLQITEQRATPTQVTYDLAGEVTVDQLHRLEGLVQSVLESGRELTFDLSGVWRVDRPSVRRIADFWSRSDSRVHLEGMDEGLLAWLGSQSNEHP